MDRNIAAFLRNNARTVLVQFSDSPGELAKTYTYVSDLPLEQGDKVIVTAQGRMSLACVVRVDEDLQIEPNSDTRYQWIVAKVDLSYHTALTEGNAEIERTVANAYRTNIRRSFADQLLSTLDDGSRASLQKLLG